MRRQRRRSLFLQPEAIVPLEAFTPSLPAPTTPDELLSFCTDFVALHSALQVDASRLLSRGLLHVQVKGILQATLLVRWRGHAARVEVVTCHALKEVAVRPPHPKMSLANLSAALAPFSIDLSRLPTRFVRVYTPR
jgi:hypothetical protein